MNVQNNTYSELVLKGLSTISDDFVLSNRKNTDNGLKRLLETYAELSDKNSTYPSITDEFTGADIKRVVNQLPFEEQLQVVYGYLAGIGRVDKHIDYDKEVKIFKIKILKWGGFSLLFLFIAVVGGVVAAGVLRNDINPNEFLNLFMGIVNKGTDIFITGRPVVE